jgi:hypothetical protein
MTLEILGAGFGRTGTLSLKAALAALGVAPCYHMVEVAAHPEHARIWAAARHAGTVDWSTLLAGYRAAVDWPAAAYWRELASTFPDARVILTIRTAQHWYESFSATIVALTSGLAPPPQSGLRAIYDLTRELILDDIFGGRAHDAAHAISIYEAHNRAVVDTIPAARLLVHDPAAGWEPLCRFLGVPIPSAPFPHLNTRSEFLRESLGRRPRVARRVAKPS